MAQIIQNSENSTCVIECNRETGVRESAIFSRFIKDMEALNSLIALDHVYMEQNAEAANQYKLLYVAKDGRSRQQTLSFEPDGIRQTLIVPFPGFYERELGLFRNSLNSFIDMITVFEITKLDYDWA